MKWVPDRTGRFGERPHFDPAEIDLECERLTSTFHRAKYGHTFIPPWTTEDLKTLLERETERLDLYADLVGREGGDVEGMTTFRPGRKPVVEIEASLTNDDRRENRLRTTITHEHTHIVLHRPVWELLWARHAAPSLDPAQAREHKGRCLRATVLGAHQTDWMEWQAGYGSGAILMPKTLVVASARKYRESFDLGGSLLEGSDDEQNLVTELIDEFRVSAEAARVRLAALRITLPAAARRQTDLL